LILTLATRESDWAAIELYLSSESFRGHSFAFMVSPQRALLAQRAKKMKTNEHNAP
jgi:hypothetical protein